jgi:hypothetical protein
MGKWVADQVLDGALQVIAGADRLYALAGQPLNFSMADSGKLAEAMLTLGDFAVAAGDVSGRKVTVAGKAGVQVTATATADHVALVDTQNSRLLYVTTCPPQALAAGGTVTFDAWAVEIGAPV